MGPLTLRVTKVEERLDHLPAPPVQPDLGPLTVRVTKVEERLDHPPAPPTQPDLGPLTARVTKLEERVDRLTPQPQAATFPATEAGLSLDQKAQIQKALGFSSRQVDGIFGPNTRLAITGFRRSKSVTTTGPLKTDEIKELLSPRNP